VTAQASEFLLYQGEKHSMCTEVLEIYFVMADMKAPFVAPHSALWRGYVGTWEIKDERLYLIDLRGQLKNGQSGSLDEIFPGFAGRVFAHWFTGRLRAPQGKCCSTCIWVSTASASLTCSLRLIGVSLHALSSKLMVFLITATRNKAIGSAAGRTLEENRGECS